MPPPTKAPEVFSRLPELDSRHPGATPFVYGAIQMQNELHNPALQLLELTEWFLEVWSRAQANGRTLPELWLVGILGPSLRKYSDLITAMKVLPNLDDDQLRQAIVSARALIYPSEIEGFGLPALEAYQLGTPAMYVADTSVDEILKVNAVSAPGRFYLEEDDFWRVFDETIHLTYEKISEVQREMCGLYSWRKTAEQTLAVYRSMIS